MPNTRREREEALIKNAMATWSTPLTNRLFIEALAAAHRREDVMRTLMRFDPDMDGEMEADCGGEYICYDDMLDVLDGDEVKG